jgi:hypothetical protein
MAGASAPKAKKNTANSDRREREQRDKRDQKESRLPLGEVSGNTSAAPSSGRKQRANEKIAYIPSAEEYLYAQHRRRIYSDEMSAMMGGEGTP